LLRNPHCAHAAGHAPETKGDKKDDKRESILHSTLFSVELQEESSRTDTTGWAHPSKTGDAEGGV
jgi:hypothetical protein